MFIYCLTLLVVAKPSAIASNSGPTISARVIAKRNGVRGRIDADRLV